MMRKKLIFMSILCNMFFSTGCGLLNGDDTKESQGQLNSSLVLSIDSRNPDDVQNYINLGADVNYLNMIPSCSPLWTALNKSGDDIEVAGMLINNGANVNEQDEQEDIHGLKGNFLHNLIESDEVKIEKIKLLIDKGIDIDKRDEEGKTPLIIAGEKGKREVYDLLIEYGADQSITYGIGITAEGYLMAAEQIAELVRNSDYLTDKRNPSIGMTEEEVLNSIWGEPKDVNRTTTKYGVKEQWVYSGYRYIYFEHGTVTTIQE